MVGPRRCVATGHGTRTNTTYAMAERATGMENWLRLLVRTRADEHGWSVRDLGRAAGITHTVAWRFLRGGSVRGGALLAMLEAVGLEVVEATGGGLRLVEEADA
jgi:hypothetical protein